MPVGAFNRELEPVIVPSGVSLSVPLGFAANTVMAASARLEVYSFATWILPAKSMATAAGLPRLVALPLMVASGASLIVPLGLAAYSVTELTLGPALVA
jgi:hypothetical protein